MPDLSFDQAYARLRSTMSDADFQEVERHGEVDGYGLPTGNKVASVVCYEPRLTNAIRKIGGWTFLVDNRFVAGAARKIAMMWLLHKGGARYGELELMRALRHCFKRFYAESLVTLATPPIGRALLLESVVFERRFMSELARHCAEASDSEASRFNSAAHETARNSVLICQRHEMAHALLSLPGEGIIDNAAKLLDGIVQPAIRRLIESGNAALAEEVFCDAFALHSIVRLDEKYARIGPGGESFYDALHLDEVRAAYFCYVVTMRLGEIWFQALHDARAGWDAAEQGTSRPERPPLPLEAQARERARLVSALVLRYIRSKNGDIHERNVYYFGPQYEQLLIQASTNVDRLSDVDELAIVAEPDREIARYLTAATWLSTSTSRYLIDAARYSELNEWARPDHPAEPEEEPPATVEAALRSTRQVTQASATAETFWKAMKGFYAEYAKVFDAIVADLLYGTALKEGTLDRLTAFKDDVCARLDAFGRDEDVYSSLLAKDYCEGARADAERRIAETHLVLLTIMRRALPGDTECAFSMSVKERLSCLEGYAARNHGANVAAFAALLIPELEAGRVVPTTPL